MEYSKGSFLFYGKTCDFKYIFASFMFLGDDNLAQFWIIIQISKWVLITVISTQMGADNGYQHPNLSADGIESAPKWGRFHGRYQHDFRVLLEVIILVTRMNEDIHPCAECWIWSDRVPTARGQTRFSKRHRDEYPRSSDAWGWFPDNTRKLSNDSKKHISPIIF